MDGADLMLTMPVTPLEETVGGGLTGITGKAKSVSAKSADAGKTEQLAKDFESVLLTKLLDEMKNTIGKWGDEEDAAADQVKGLFWLCLGRELADKGGLGLWKDLNRFFTDLQKPDASAQSLDESL
jgi:Rod binding domain-containing protein